MMPRLVLAVAVFAVAWTMARPAPVRDPSWASTRSHRILVKVDAVDIGGRASDEGPAEVSIDFDRTLSSAGIAETADLSTLQVMRYASATGLPVRYPNNLYGETPYDIGLRWYDAAIPEPFPDRDRSLKSPWIERSNWGGYYEVIGEWKRGRLAWSHTQGGSQPSHYAVYFNTLPKGGRPSAREPRGWIGDGSNRTARVGRQFTGLYIPDCQMVDFNQDGLLDLVCGSSRGAVLWYENLGTRQKPSFTVARLLFQSDGRPIDPGFLSTPALSDWDHDGKRDLLMGAAKGWVYFYRNVGTEKNPRYEDQGPVQLGGKDLRPPFSPVPEVAGPNGESIYKEDYEPFVEVADWDGDGNDDLLLGGYVTGRVFCYRSTGRDARGVPILEDRGPLMADGKPIDVGWAASPTVGDLDGDGDLDLIVGNWRKWGNESPPEIVEDFLAYYENVGSRKSPVLTMKPLPRIGKFPADDITTPSLADWDGDGDLDLSVSTQGGNLYLIENIGTPHAPKFDGRRLSPLTMPWSNDPLPRGGDTAPAQFIDWNGDGRPDLVQGYYVIENASSSLPWAFRPARSLLPADQTIDHRSWRGDDWQYTVMVDFDGDGRKDILFGDYWGNVWFHRNLFASGATSFDTKGVRITDTRGTPLRVGLTSPKPYDFDTMQGPRTSLVAADFDGDGSIDLVLNDVYGHYYFCRRGNLGTLPKVESQTLIHQFDRYSFNTVVDWNGDGKPDVLASVLQTYYLFRNVSGTAAQTSPANPFAPPEKLDLPLVPVIGSVVSAAMVDANRDGDTDLVLMSDHGYDCLFEKTFLDKGYRRGTVEAFQSRKK